MEVKDESIQEASWDRLLEDLESDMRMQTLDERFNELPPKLSTATDHSADLVLKDWLERDVVDDLTGEYLPPELVRKAKIDELMEIYRRGVWSETCLFSSAGRKVVLHPSACGGWLSIKVTKTIQSSEQG